MCKEKKIIYNRTTQSGRLPLPEIPESRWCDFRRDYESGMTLKKIAEKYICDPRTVRKCIIANKPSSELGRQTEPTKLAAYIDRINSLYKDYVIVQQLFKKNSGICDISRRITEVITSEGYSGSERTVRNYLRSQYQYITDPDEMREEK